MELTSIYGEMFSGEIVSELTNVVIAEDYLGNRYTVHKSTLGKHTPIQQSGAKFNSFSLKDSIQMGVPPKRVFEKRLRTEVV